MGSHKGACTARTWTLTCLAGCSCACPCSRGTVSRWHTQLGSLLQDTRLVPGLQYHPPVSVSILHRHQTSVGLLLQSLKQARPREAHPGAHDPLMPDKLLALIRPRGTSSFFAWALPQDPSPSARPTAPLQRRARPAAPAENWRSQGSAGRENPVRCGAPCTQPCPCSPRTLQADVPCTSRRAHTAPSRPDALQSGVRLLRQAFGALSCVHQH